MILTFFSFSVTRKTAKLLEKNGINREIVVELSRNCQLEALSYFQKQQRTTASPGFPARPTRRASVAGTNLFHVGNAIRETGFDYLLKIRTNRIAQLQPAAVPSFGAVASAAAVTSTAPVASVGSIGGADLTDFGDLARAGGGSVNFGASTSNAPQFHGIRANDDEKEAVEDEAVRR